MPSNVAELVKTGTSTKIDLTESTLNDYMAMRFEGFITTPSDGSYTFALYSDEGSKMRIDDQLVVNNDGVHTAKNKAGSPITLTQGEHSIKVEYFELVGSQTLKAYRKGPNFVTQEIPSSALRPKTSTPPTSTCTLSADAGPDQTITLPTSTITLA